MNEEEFSSLFRDVISHLYDYSVLETSPLVGSVTPQAGFQGGRGAYFRQIVLEEVERFRPEGKDESWHAVEWRAYHILKGRYADGESTRELAQKLALSERQLRRHNSRALTALTKRMWDRLLVSDQSQQDVEQDSEDEDSFEVDLETLDVASLVEGVSKVLSNRIEAEGRHLILDGISEPILATADRIVVRQILISLIGYFINLPCKEEIVLRVRPGSEQVEIHISSKLADRWTQEDEVDHRDLSSAVRLWSQRLNAVVEESYPEPGETGEIELIFRLPLAEQRVILVVDDQKPTHQMFQRFMSRTPYRIVGATSAEEAISKARQLQPSLITLDVMIPKVDGWEILQALKTDSETREIPVLVCSAWAEPELAQSLGAAGFLKKPVTQRDLFAALCRLDL